MSSEKYILFSLDDDKSKKLGEAISNSTCKKILGLLSEKELSEEDISKELKIPLTTTEYNLKKLLHSGLIEKSENFFWSKRGKKILTYKVANKLIVISPKKSNVYSKLKSIVPVVLISGIFTFLISIYSRTQNFSQDILLKTENSLAGAQQISTFSSSGNWIWFLAGWFSFMIIFLIWNWRRN